MLKVRPELLRTHFRQFRIGSFFYKTIALFIVPFDRWNFADLTHSQYPKKLNMALYGNPQPMTFQNNQVFQVLQLWLWRMQGFCILLLFSHNHWSERKRAREREMHFHASHNSPRPKAALERRFLGRSTYFHPVTTPQHMCQHNVWNNTRVLVRVFSRLQHNRVKQTQNTRGHTLIQLAKRNT